LLNAAPGSLGIEIEELAKGEGEATS